MTVLTKVKSALGIKDKPAVQHQAPTTRRYSAPRQRTPNQIDFNRMRAATLQVVHPTQPEPWFRKRTKDGKVERYQRCIDENLPLGSFPELLEQLQTFRVYFFSTKQALELKPDQTVHKITTDDDGNKSLVECGIWHITRPDGEQMITVDTDYGPRDVNHKCIDVNGRRFASPRFYGSLNIQASGLVDQRGEVVECDITMPIYMANVKRIAKDREGFLSILRKRDNCSREYLNAKGWRQPTIKCHEAYLLRPGQLHNCGQTRFDIREIDINDDV